MSSKNFKPCTDLIRFAIFQTIAPVLRNVLRKRRWLEAKWSARKTHACDRSHTYYNQNRSTNENYQERQNPQQPGCDRQERGLQRTSPRLLRCRDVVLLMRWKPQSRAGDRLQLRVPSTMWSSS